MALAAVGLCRRYGPGPAVLDGVDLAVGPGECVAVVGRSGSGKSTLLAALGALARPDAGTVTLDGKPLTAADRGRGVGHVFQFPGLLPGLRAVDNVALPAVLAGTPAPAAYGRAAELLARVGLGDRLAAYPAGLSGGEQRRVSVARALASGPRVLLADEPTADLDAATEAEVVELLCELRRECGFALVAATHSPMLAARADRVLRLEAGRLQRAAEFTPAVSAPRAAGINPAARHEVPALPGGRLRSALVSAAALVLPAALTVAGIDFAVVRYQSYRLTAQRTERESLEEAALFWLRLDPDDVRHGDGGRTTLTLSLRNTSGEPLTVAAPAVRAYVQVGGAWREVPCRPLGEAVGRAFALEGKRTLAYEFEPDVPDFTELLPGYRHVRFAVSLPVRKGADPAAPVCERADQLYVYLKDRRADDAAILAKTRFPGRPPVWIPMPPH